MSFPSGLTLRCYDTDSTCTTETNVKEFDYAEDGEYQSLNPEAVNICCFILENNVVTVNGYQPSNYYTVTGSKCQSCLGVASFS